MYLIVHLCVMYSYICVMWFICSTIFWSKIEPYKVHLVCSPFKVYFFFLMYLYWCIVSNICTMMHPGDVMVDGTINVSAWAVIVGGGDG